MRFCTSCGHELGSGRFCTHCGHRVARPVPTPASVTPAARAVPTTGAPPEMPEVSEVSATAERRAARREAAMEPTPPRTPPSAADTPPAPRYPLYADEVAATGATIGPPTSHPTSHPTSDASLLDRLSPVRRETPHPDRGDHDQGGQHPGHHQGYDEPRRRRPLLLAALVVAVLVAAVLVAWRVAGDGGTIPGEDTVTATDTVGRAQPVGGPGDATGDGSGGGLVDLSAGATAQVPGHAPPAVQVDGERATYVGEHLLDADAGTAWRVAGDASGEEIVLRLPEAARITRVGLVNGYAKRDRDAQGRTFDSYHGHRRVTAVTWVLDGTEVTQELGRGRDLQVVDVDPVSTETVTLRLRTVSEPGTGRAGRDFTAISDVALLGRPAER